jgi:hypothetical protein
MLISAAAELWELPTAACRAADGVIFSTLRDQAINYVDIASRAAWLTMPTTVRLRSGEMLDMSFEPQRECSSVAAMRRLHGVDVR